MRHENDNVMTIDFRPEFNGDSRSRVAYAEAKHYLAKIETCLWEMNEYDSKNLLERISDITERTIDEWRDQ